MTDAQILSLLGGSIILLFVLADGWNLIIGNLVRTFY